VGFYPLGFLDWRNLAQFTRLGFDKKGKKEIENCEEGGWVEKKERKADLKLMPGFVSSICS